MSRIVLVSDDPKCLASLQDLLETRQEFVVCGVAQTRAGAIKAVKLHRPGLVILDFAMPLTKGFETADALRAALPGIQLFLLVERQGFEVEKEALSRGIHAVFAKNEDLTPLLSNALAACNKENHRGDNGSSLA